jgi:hypothetical protein
LQLSISYRLELVTVLRNKGLLEFTVKPEKLSLVFDWQLGYFWVRSIIMSGHGNPFKHAFVCLDISNYSDLLKVLLVGVVHLFPFLVLSIVPNVLQKLPLD